MMNALLNLAMAPPPGGEGQSQQSPMFMLGWIILMVGIFYFLMIRPQQRKEKERRAMISAVKSGDRILFGGGILGLVSNVKEKTLVVKIADGVKIEVARHAVTQVLGKDDEMEEETRS
jgi:preprotein translocase subunit YajC